MTNMYVEGLIELTRKENEMVKIIGESTFAKLETHEVFALEERNEIGIKLDSVSFLILSCSQEYFDYTGVDCSTHGTLKVGKLSKKTQSLWKEDYEHYTGIK